MRGEHEDGSSFHVPADASEDALVELGADAGVVWVHGEGFGAPNEVFVDHLGGGVERVAARGEEPRGVLGGEIGKALAEGGEVSRARLEVHRGGGEPTAHLTGDGADQASLAPPSGGCVLRRRRPRAGRLGRAHRVRPRFSLVGDVRNNHHRADPRRLRGDRTERATGVRLE